jgi:hypothetical protein
MAVAAPVNLRKLTTADEARNKIPTSLVDAFLQKNVAPVITADKVGSALAKKSEVRIVNPKYQYVDAEGNLSVFEDGKTLYKLRNVILTKHCLAKSNAYAEALSTTLRFPVKIACNSLYKNNVRKKGNTTFYFVKKTDPKKEKLSEGLWETASQHGTSVVSAGDVGNLADVNE